MTITRDWYEFVMAQMAADSYLDNNDDASFDFNDRDDLVVRLQNGANYYTKIEEQDENGPLSATRMTAQMANDFVDTWEVIDHLPNTTSGFSATVLRHKVSGRYTFSLRSTESKDASDGGDVERDSFDGANGQLAFDGFAWGQLRDMENYYQRLRAGTLASGSAADGAALAASLATDPINVTGYSLGGHLAQMFTLMHPHDIEQTVAINGAGFGAIANLDPLTEYGPAILERIDRINTAMADPLTILEQFDADVLANLIDDLVDGSVVNLLTGSPSLRAMLDLVTDIKSTVFGTAPPDRVYDDPYFKLALSILPADTTGASAVGLQESVNYTREQITANEKITNLYGHSFSGERSLDEFTAGSGQITGSYFPVYIEDQPLLGTNTDVFPPSLDAILRSFGPTHSIALIADSLAVMDLYATLDPSLVSEVPGATETPPTMRLNRLFESMTNSRARLITSPRGEGNTLEAALDSLGRFVLGSRWVETPSSDAPGAYGDLGERKPFYDQIQLLRDALFEGGALKPVYSGLTIVPLGGIAPATLAERAETDVAYRYALRELNPFVVTGDESLYAQHNKDGVLDAGQSGSAYWFDRANFMAGLIEANIGSRATSSGEPYLLSGTDVEYSDTMNDAVLHEVTPFRVIFQRTSVDLQPASNDVILVDDRSDKVSRVTFSDMGTITGANGDDRIYGEYGNNEIRGLAGEDIIEGGFGNDTLFGNDIANADDQAADILKGGPGSDTYFANFGDVIDDLDGLGVVNLRNDLLKSGYREVLDAPGTFTSEDRRYTYTYEDVSQTLKITVKDGDPLEALTIAGFSPGQLGIQLNGNPQPTDSRFLGSNAGDTITVDLTGTEISGVIDGDAIDPVALYTPQVEAIAARGGDDRITVHGDVPGIRIHGDRYVAGAADDGHDDIAVDVERVANGVVGMAIDEGARIYGGGGNDRIQGGQRNDELLGEGGNDWIAGHGGNDRISGGDDDPDVADNGNDVLMGEFGEDQLFGRGGDDVLLGGQGSDRLLGGAGDDALYGDLIAWGYHVADPGGWAGPSNTRNDDGVYVAAPGAGADIATPATAGSHVVFDEARDTSAGNDELDGGAGDDHLLGGMGDDTLNGGADRDLLEGEEGNDELFGGSGNDTLYGDISPATLENHSAVVGSGMAADGPWTQTFRTFSNGPDAGGNDTLDGGENTDVLFGGVGDDVLDGGRFDHAVDILYGGADNDDYRFGFGDGRTLVYDDDGGADRIVFRDGVTPDDVHIRSDDTGSSLVIAVTLNGHNFGDELIISNWYRGNTVESFAFESGLTWTAAFVVVQTGREVDAMDPVDNGGFVLAASDQADVSLGSSGNEEVYLFAGDDQFSGGGGNDRVFGGAGGDALQGNDGNDVVSGESGDDQLYGQAGNDTLYGGAGDDALSGGGGADSLLGGKGADNLLGGLDNDTYAYGRGDGEDFIRDDGGTADRIVFGAGIAPDDVTVASIGDTIVLNVRSSGALVGDQITIVDGFLSATEIEAVEFIDGFVWGKADITSRLPDAYALDDGIVVAGSENVTTYTLATRLDDGFMIALEDAGGIDTLDLKIGTSGSGALTPVLNSTSRSGNDLLLDVTVESVIATIPDATGEIRINGFYNETGFIETIRFGSIEMNAVNAAPVVAAPLIDQLIRVDTPYTMTLPGGTFNDSAFDRLTLSAALDDGTELPAWLVFDAATGTLTGTPTAGDEGIVDVAVTATDAKGLMAISAFELNVGNVNVAPILTVPIPGQSAGEGDVFSFTLPTGTFTDINPDDTLSLSAQIADGNPLPAWLSFDDQTNTFSGTPGTSDVALRLVEVTATDSGGLTLADVFALNVDYLNDSPTVVIEPADQVFKEQQTFSFMLPPDTFTDGDTVHGDRLDYTVSSQSGVALPGWLLFDDESLTFSGRAVGIFADTDIDLRITATDNDGASAAADFTLEVSDIAAAPAWFIPHDVTEPGSTAFSRSASVTTALTGGGYVIAWESADRDGDERGIYVQRYDNSGVAVGAVMQANSTTVADQRALAVAGLAAGGFVVSWVSLHEDDGNQVLPLNDGGGIYAQLFSVDGDPIGGETRVNHVRSGIQNQTAIAGLSDGGYVITWFSQFTEQRINNGEYGVGDPGFFGQRFDAAGTLLGTATRLADAGISNLEPSVAGLPGGGFVMVWTGTDSDGSGIRAQRYSAAGLSEGAEILVNTWVGDRQSDPQVAALETGGFVVVWRSEDQDFSGGGIYGQRYSGSGTAIGDEFRVNTTTSGSQGDPSVSAAPDGGFVVSWVSGAVDGIGGVYAQQYDAAGTRIDGETLVGAPGHHNDQPSVAVLEDGSLVHSWTATDAGWVSADPNHPAVLAGPTRIESERVELRANTPLEVVRPVVALEASEFRSIIYRVEENVFFDPDVGYGDSVTFGATLADGDPLPGWLAFDSTTATLSGLPLSGQAGTVDVRLTAIDSSGAVGESIVTIRINAAADITVTASPATYTVNSVEPLLNNNPDSAVLANGSHIVVWNSETGVRGQRFAADGAPISGEVRIDSYGSPVARAYVTSLDDGGFAVVWAGSGGSIRGRRYDASGLPTVGEFEIEDGSLTGVADFGVAGLAGGGFVVTWSTDAVGGDGQVLARRFDASGVPVPIGPDIAFDTNLGDAANLDVTDLAAGGFVVTWNKVNTAGQQVIVGRRYATSGAAFDDEFQINDPKGLVNVDPSVAGLADGGFLVTWTVGDGQQDDVHARLFDSLATPRGNAWRVNNTTNSEQRYATATATSDGGFVIAWHSETWTVPDEYGFIQAQHFDRNGNPTGDFFSVSLESTQLPEGPAVSASADGGFDIVWASDFETDGAETDSIKGRHFSVTGSASNLLPVVAAPIADQLTSEAVTYSFVVPANTVSDPEGDAITYRATLAGGTALPDWLNFNPTTRELRGTPTESELGSTLISVVGADRSGDAVAETFTLTVENVNDTPIAVVDIAGLRLDEGDKTLTLDVLANDTDIDAGDDPSTFSLDSVTVTAGLGSATILGNRLRFEAGTDFDDLSPNEIREVTIGYTMSDTSGEASSATATIAVHNGALVVPNQAAGFVHVTTPTNYFGPGTFRFGYGSSGSRMNIGNGFGHNETRIQISNRTGVVHVGRSSGAGISGSGTLEALGLELGKSKISLGSMLVTFAGTDVAIHIEDFDPNDVYAAHPLINTFVFGGIPYSYEEFVSRGFDLDGTAGDDTISGTNTVDRIAGRDGADTLAGGDGDDIITGGSGGDTINGGNGNDTYIFGVGDGHDVVSDTQGFDRIIFTAGVTSAESASARVGNDLLLTLSPTDSITLKNWYVDPQYRIETFAFTDDNLRIVAADTAETIDQNHAPTVLLPTPDQSATPGTEFSYLIPAGAFADVDLDSALTFSANRIDGSPLSGWLDFAPANRSFAGTPATGDAGDLMVRITAADSGGLYVVDEFTITTQGAAGSTAPVVAAAIPDRSVIEGRAFYFAIAPDAFADPDPDDSLTLSATLDDGSNLPEWLAFDPTTRIFHGVVPSGSGDVAIKVTAADESAMSVSDSFELVVETSSNTMTGDALPNTINGTAMADRIAGLGGDDNISALGGDDELVGGPGSDDLFGGDGNDVFIVDGIATGFDRFNGGDGFDVVVGSAGDDLFGMETFAADNRVEVIDGGAGFDTIITIAGAVLDFSETILVGIEEIRAGAGNNRIIGSIISDTIFAGPGNDTITDINGDNKVHGGANNDTITTGAGNDTLYGGAHDDTIDAGDGINRVYGGRGNDAISTGDGADWIDGGSGFDVIRPGPGDDVVFGRSGADSIVDLDGNHEFHGGANNDTITTGDGNDILYGDAHNDSIDAGDGDNTIYGGRGNDVITTGSGTDWIDGGSGFDVIHSGPGDDIVFGRTGADTIVGVQGDHVIHGGANDDTITTGDGNDTLYGGAHDDWIDAGDGDNTIYGGRGNDVIKTGDGADWIDGGSGFDVIDSGPGDDIVFGRGGVDAIVALDGNHEIHGGENDDTITTGKGNDVIYGDGHDDTINAGSGADTAYGGTGDDFIFGGAGDDRIEGGPGFDFIRGGTGNDTLVGGSFGDTYYFDRFDGSDVVVESDTNSGDVLEFGESIAIDQIWFSKAGNDLRLDIVGTADAVVVQGWYSAAKPVERFDAGGGSYLVNSNVEQLVQAMAAFDIPAGADTSLPIDVAERIDPVIAAVWQTSA